jgi:hypothetical protein
LSAVTAAQPSFCFEVAGRSRAKAAVLRRATKLLFTRETTRFVQFIVLTVLIALVFCTPGIVQALASGITNALGVHQPP